MSVFDSKIPVVLVLVGSVEELDQLDCDLNVSPGPVEEKRQRFHEGGSYLILVESDGSGDDAVHEFVFGLWRL